MQASVRIGFKAFDPHELLCHFIAVAAGLYQEAEITPRLVDITFTPAEEMADDLFQVSCGAALMNAIRGTPQKILFVATDRPMFWVYAGKDITGMADLRGKRIATYPRIAPPHHLLNAILAHHDMTDNKGVRRLPARDDGARLGLLRSGDVDAAVISSALSPVHVTRLGFNELCCFGDYLRIPTTGLAVHDAYLQGDTDTCRRLVNILRQALSLLHTDTALVTGVLERTFDVAADISEETLQRLRLLFGRDGRTTDDIAMTAVTNMSRTLDVAPVPAWDRIYDFSL